MFAFCIEFAEMEISIYFTLKFKAGSTEHKHKVWVKMGTNQSFKITRWFVTCFKQVYTN